MFVDENTKKIADEVIGLTKAGVTEIWQKIQQAAPELWKMAVRRKWPEWLCRWLTGHALVKRWARYDLDLSGRSCRCGWYDELD